MKKRNQLKLPPSSPTEIVMPPHSKANQTFHTCWRTPVLWLKFQAGCPQSLWRRRLQVGSLKGRSEVCWIIWMLWEVVLENISDIVGMILLCIWRRDTVLGMCVSIICTWNVCAETAPEMCVLIICTWNVCAETVPEMCVLIICTWNGCAETVPEMCVLIICTWNVCVQTSLKICVLKLNFTCKFKNSKKKNQNKKKTLPHQTD